MEKRTSKKFTDKVEKILVLKRSPTPSKYSAQKSKGIIYTLIYEVPTYRRATTISKLEQEHSPPEPPRKSPQILAKVVLI